MTTTNYDYGFEEYCKTPTLLYIDKNTKKKTILSTTYQHTRYKYNGEPDFAVHLCVYSIMLIDFDVNKEGKIDGAVWFEEKFGPITDNFGLVTRTPSGGYHAFIKVDDSISSSIGIISEDKHIAIDILGHDNVAFQGRYYPVIKNSGVQEIPIKFKEFLTGLKRQSTKTPLIDFLEKNQQLYAYKKIGICLTDKISKDFEGGTIDYDYETEIDEFCIKADKPKGYKGRDD